VAASSVVKEAEATRRHRAIFCTQNTGEVLPRKSIGNMMVCLAVMLVLVSGIFVVKEVVG
jgi:hypothetical protein